MGVGKPGPTKLSEDEMHEEFTRQLMNDHINALRHDAAVSRVRRPRRHLRNPLRRAAA